MTQEHKKHPADIILADYLDNCLTRKKRRQVETHINGCAECLDKMVSAYESVRNFRKFGKSEKRKARKMGRINFYLLLAAISFTLSFVIPKYFIQLLAATMLLGIKWVIDSKTTKMLVMIHEAWKNGGERGAAEVISRFDSDVKTRL
jgi:hypothetical protein